MEHVSLQVSIPPETAPVASVHVEVDDKPADLAAESQTFSMSHFSTALQELDRRIDAIKQTPLVAPRRADAVNIVQQLHDAAIRYLNATGAETIYSRWMSVLGHDPTAAAIVASPQAITKSAEEYVQRVLDTAKGLLEPSQQQHPLTHPIVEGVNNTNMLRGLSDVENRCMAMEIEYNRNVYALFARTLKAYSKCTQWVADDVWQRIAPAVEVHANSVKEINAKLGLREAQLKSACVGFQREWEAILGEYEQEFGDVVPSHAKAAYEARVGNLPISEQASAMMHAFTHVWTETQKQLQQDVSGMRVPPEAIQTARHALQLAQKGVHVALREVYTCHIQMASPRQSAEAGKQLKAMQDNERLFRRLATQSVVSPHLPHTHEKWRTATEPFEKRARTCRATGMMLAKARADRVRNSHDILRVQVQRALVQYYEDTEKCQKQLISRERHALGDLNADMAQCVQTLHSNRKRMRRAVLVGGGDMRAGYVALEEEVTRRTKQLQIASLKTHAASVRLLCASSSSSG
jgi:arsenate reductase-like glutaredoxin family protein